MERVDVAVVGGGPAGAAAAHAAATEGASAAVFEKGVPRDDRDGLGPDSTDAAGILDYWVDLMGIHPEEFPDGVLQHELDRAEFHGPTESCTLTGTGIDSSYDQFGYTFHRARFDDFLRERAEAAGATYRTGTAVRGVEHHSHGTPRNVVELADGREIAADYVVLADGPQRTVTNRVLSSFLPGEETMGERLPSTEANHIAYQEYRRFPEEVYADLEDAIVFWWGLMPGHTAYPWVFPNENRVCRVGLTTPIGIDIDAVENREAYDLVHPDDESIPQGATYIERLIEREWGDEYDLDDFPIVEDAGKSGGTETYPISSTRPIDSPVEAGIAVAGGAMGTTSAFHEGGDHVAVRTGALAGELAATGELYRYNDAWKSAVGEELRRNVAMADMVRDYGPADWDGAFQTARRMLDGADGYEMFDRRFGAGWEATKLVVEYKLRKFRLRGGEYVQLSADEYAY